MKTIQHKSHARVTLEALVAVFLAVLFAGLLQAQESKTKGLETAKSSIQGVLSAVGPEGQPTPLEGVTLKLSGDSLDSQGRSALTDADGHYEFNRLDAGAYSLEASLEGFTPFAQTIVLKANETRTEDV